MAVAALRIETLLKTMVLLKEPAHALCITLGDIKLIRCSAED